MRYLVFWLVLITPPVFAEDPHVHHDHGHMGKELGANYTCPMHPNIKQSSEGRCPICGMDLVKVPVENLESKKEPKASVYTCPMHPNIHEDTPGRCPHCGMSLVPKETPVSASRGGVALGVASRRIAGIETETLQRMPANLSLRAVGTIDFDESKVVTVAAYVSGRIEKLYANYIGVSVKKGEHLALIYSPDLYAAQVEYLQSLKGGSLQKRLIQGTRNKLEELGMLPAQIKALGRSGRALSRMTIFSSASGTVIAKDVMEGHYVKAGQTLFRVADLSTLWLLLDLYPEEAARLRYGLKVNVTVDAHPNRLYTGRISFIDPFVDKKKRTVRVRVVLNNAQGKLRPGDYASASIAIPLGESETLYDPDLAGKWISPMHPQHIHDKPGQCPVCGMDMVAAATFGFANEAPSNPGVITVPRNAVLSMGNKSAVYVEGEGKTFTLREVVLGGLTSDGRVHVLKGLEAGESIATQGVFLLDSQTQLSGKTSLIDISGSEKADHQTKHHH